jgi:hypothetical protein
MLERLLLQVGDQSFIVMQGGAADLQPRWLSAAIPFIMGWHGQRYSCARDLYLCLLLCMTDQKGAVDKACPPGALPGTPLPGRHSSLGHLCCAGCAPCAHRLGSPPPDAAGVCAVPVRVLPPAGPHSGLAGVCAGQV